MSQVPDTCVCGGLTGTVTSPTTTVLLPSIPWKVQNPPPTEEILVIDSWLAVDKNVRDPHSSRPDKNM